MQSDETPVVRCPLCGHSPCEVLEIGSDPQISIPNPNQLPRPKIHARCPKCSAEFHVTVLAK